MQIIHGVLIFVIRVGKMLKEVVKINKKIDFVA